MKQSFRILLLLLVWDLISVVIAIDSGIISEYKDVRFDVDDVPAFPFRQWPKMCKFANRYL